jgi:flagellar hook-associated protein 1 FlgK
MQTTSHNIANASVEGYSRQNTELATARAVHRRRLLRPRRRRGHRQRTHDAFLTREAPAPQVAGLDGRHARDRLQQLETVFRTGEQGMGTRSRSCSNADVGPGQPPADGATRQVVLARAQDLAAALQRRRRAARRCRRHVNQDLQASVTAVNGAGRQHRQGQPARSPPRGPRAAAQRPAGRARPAAQLSRTRAGQHHRCRRRHVGVFMGGGQRLVLGSAAEKLSVVPDLFDARARRWPSPKGRRAALRLPKALGGGRIAGLLQFQNQDLVAAQAMLGQLARPWPVPSTTSRCWA